MTGSQVVRLQLQTSRADCCVSLIELERKAQLPGISVVRDRLENNFELHVCVRASEKDGLRDVDEGGIKD